jgi:hypothetical protein
VTKRPWEYLFDAFNQQNFPDLYAPIWISSAVLLVTLVILYNVRTRQLHRHRIYVDMYEWLLWAGTATFGLIVIGALFAFDFFLVTTTILIGFGAMIWIRFRRFPPLLRAYSAALSKQRYLSRQKYAHPEATIRRRPVRRTARRRR